MALDLGTLRAYLDLDSTSWSGSFDKAQTTMQKFSGGVPTWMGVASAAVIAGGIAAAAGLYKIGEAWDDVRDTIRVGTGAVGEDLEGLVDIAKRIAENVPVDIGVIAPALSDLHQRLGLTGDQLYDVTSQVLNVGRMLKEDVDIDSVTASFSAFGVENDDVSGKMDFLYQMSQATGIGFNDLTSKLAAAAPITQQLGYTFEETAALIGTMDKAGLDSQTMIGAMQKGLVNLTKPGESAEDAFKRVTGQIQGFIDTGDDASAMDLAGQIFGTRGAAQFIGALQNGKLNLDDLIGSAGLTGDTISQAAADTNDFAEKWQLVQNKASAALEPLASTVFSALGDALTAMMPGLTGFTNWLSENPEMLQVFAAVIGVIAVAFIGLTVATWALNTALLANPITWIVLAVVALIAAIILLIMNWDTVVKFLGDTWAGFVGWLTGVMEGFGGWWNDVWNGFIGFVTDVWDGFVGFLQDVWQGFVNWIIGVLIGWFSMWRDIWLGVSSFFSDLWNGIIGFVTDAWGNIMAFLGGIPGKILAVFLGAGKWLYDIGSDILQGLWDGLTSVWNGLVGWIGDIGQTIADTFAGVLGIHSPSRVFREYGVNTLQGYVEGLDAMQPTLDRRMTSLARTPEMAAFSSSSQSAAAAASSSSSRSVTYVAAENQSLSSEEALFAALGSPRVRGNE
jgi:TP901 family phage tail tape measure protein